jgi:hypothetical protein
MQVLLQTSIADYKYPVLPQLLARRPIVHVQVHSAHPASSKDSPCNEAEEHLSIFPQSPFPSPHSPFPIHTPHFYSAALPLTMAGLTSSSGTRQDGFELVTEATYHSMQKGVLIDELEADWVSLNYVALPM